MASENLAKLQATVNRFASEAGFSRLAIDGGMGTKTAQAVFATLGWVGGSDACIDGDPIELCVDAADKETSRSLLSAMIDANGAIDQQKIMQTNVGLNTFLSRVADSISLDQAALVSIAHPSTGFTPDRSAFIVKPPPGAGFVTGARLWFMQRPQWQQAGIGIGGGIALLIAFTKFRNSRASSKGKR